MELLGIKNPSSFPVTAKEISSAVKPKIYYKNGKGRLVEAPFNDLKVAQKYLLLKLQKLDFDNYIFCGIKGRTVADNAVIHSGCKYVYQTDLSKFFPHITRNKVYKFFNDKLNMSQDVAKLLAEMCTIDYSYVDKTTHKEVYDFLKENKLRADSHLMTGSPVSCILSYLVNEDMFNLIYQKAKKSNISMSIYIDDITFSCEKPITNEFIRYVNRTLKHFGYKISAYKCQYNVPGKAKKITGVYIDKSGNIRASNQIKYKIHNGLQAIKRKEKTNISELRGYLSFASLIEPKYKCLQKQISDAEKE